MIEITANEARVLGVLIEKALTTPDQYPLSLNAIVNGSNQKNNRDPVMQMSEDAAFEAAEGLRGKGLAVRVDQMGSRVNKYKHAAGEKLAARTAEIAILAELLLRGPQTLGEIRTRASRMAPLESLDVVKGLVSALMERPEPLVKMMPGGRADRYAQLLAPEAHVMPTEDSDGGVPAIMPASGLSARVAQLESEVVLLRGAIQKLASRIGEPDPTINSGN